MTEGIKLNKSIELVSEKTGWSYEEAKEKMDHAKTLGMTYYRYAHNDCWNLNDEEIKNLAIELEQQAQARKEKIEEVCSKTGWEYEKAKAEMDKARELGMPYFRYLNNECWNLNDEEIAALAEKINRREKRRKEQISLICEQMGCDAEFANNQLKLAKKYGIKNKRFIDKHLFELSEEEIKQYVEQSEVRKERLKEDKEFYIAVLCEKTGWSREKAEEEMAEAKDQGIGYMRYMQQNIWELDEEKVSDVKVFLEADKKRIGGNKNIYIEKICKVTGWSRGKTELEVLKSRNATGCSYEDYFVFKFYEIPIEQQIKYVTLDVFKKMRIKYNLPVVGRYYFDNKARFNETFKDLITRAWFLNTDLSYEQFKEKIKGLDAVLVKAIAATQGKGVYKFKVNISEEDNRRVYEEICSLEESIVEQYIIQHSEMMKFCPTSVNTVRVTTLNYNGKCEFLYSVFRMGRGEVVDNFHAGGIAAAVDVHTGIVCTDAVDLDANVYEIHPYSGLKIKGFQIPLWDKIREVCEKATGKVEDVNLIGWDFAITEDGVELIEGNPGASYVVAQIPFIKDRIGLRPVMADPYL